MNLTGVTFHSNTNLKLNHSTYLISDLNNINTLDTKFNLLEIQTFNIYAHIHLFPELSILKYSLFQLKNGFPSYDLIVCY